MTIITTALCVVAFFLGHIIRDGWPPLGTTQGARALGAFVCGLGALVVSGNLIFAVIVFAGILAGFYADMKHGEAAGVGTPTAVADAFLSGITSLVPMAVALVVINWPHSWWWGAVAAVGLLKAAIWKAAWPLTKGNTFWYATRVAAGAFGAAIGGAVAAAWLLQAHA